MTGFLWVNSALIDNMRLAKITSIRRLRIGFCIQEQYGFRGNLSHPTTVALPFLNQFFKNVFKLMKKIRVLQVD